MYARICELAGEREKDQLQIDAVPERREATRVEQQETTERLCEDMQQETVEFS